jgi:aspartate/methionine/tyrosine aminotransferase
MFSDRTKWNLSANRLSEALARHRASGKPLLDLTVSNPTECGFAYPPTVLSALVNPAALAYSPEPRGLEVARRAASSYYAARGDDVEAGDIFLTTSTSEAYSFAFRLLCNPGDEILIPAPSYPLLEYLADLHDVKLIHYPLVYDHGWQIDFRELEWAITERTRGVIVVNPNNPTVHFCKPPEIARLNEICAARSLAIIADEVFLDFALSGERAGSFAANSATLTFALSGISKICGLPQMKAAWLAVSGPADLKHEATARLEVIADTFLSMNAPVQLALPSFLELRHDFQRRLMTRLRANLAELDRQLAAQSSCSRLECEGGWYAVLRVPATRSDEELAIDLLASRDVYVHPGHFFDFRHDGYLVVSLLTPESALSEALSRLILFF